MGDEFRIGLSENLQTGPKVAYGDGIYFVLWTENGAYIKGARVTPQGVLLDMEPISVDTGGLYAVCYGDSLFLVVIAKKHKTMGLWFTSEGKKLSNETIIDTTIGPAACTFDGENFVVCWICKRGSGDELRVVKVSPEGKVLGEPKVLVRTGYILCGPAIVCVNERYFIVYGIEGYYESNLYGIELNEQLEKIKSFAIADDPSISEGTMEGEYSVKGNNTFCVSYATLAQSIVAKIYSNEGNFITKILLTDEIGLSPPCAFNGNNYMIIWSGHAVIIDETGTRIAEIEIPIRYGYQISGSQGQFLIVYTRRISSDWQSSRIFGRIVWDVEACREHFVAYPNPCRDFINLQLIAVGDEEVDVRVYDVMGRLRIKEVLQLNGFGTQTFKIDLSELPQGIYFLRVERGDKFFKNKIIKVR